MTTSTAMVRIDFQDVRDSNEDLGEPFLDGDFFWDTGEPFVDQPDPFTGVFNGVWDAGELFLRPAVYFRCLFGLAGQWCCRNTAFADAEWCVRWSELHLR